MVELTLIQKIAIWALPLIFAIVIHEVAHGWMASFFGDQTARLSGRLTINPVKHIDVLGTIVVPFILLLFSNFIFGWAKPIPIDPRNFRHPKTDIAFVALAGPLANFVMAFFWAGIAKIGFLILNTNPWAGVPLIYMGEAGIMINVVLGVLNCLPIPPLDGGRVVASLIPGRIAWKLMQYEQIGFFILVLLMISGLLSYVLGPPVFFITGWIANIFGI